jgi:hypothetical protein
MEIHSIAWAQIAMELMLLQVFEQRAAGAVYDAFGLAGGS